jgi:1,4-alpha-glucan branching enzyme
MLRRCVWNAFPRRWRCRFTTCTGVALARLDSVALGISPSVSPKAPMSPIYRYFIYTAAALAGCMNGAVEPAASRDNLGVSARPGMCATAFPGGTLFHVFAPNATQVFVAGDFHAWRPDQYEMHADGNGNFTGEVAAVRAGHTYKYFVHHGADTFWKTDPRSALLTDANNNSVVVDHGAFKWSPKPFTPPPIERQIIYEMHIGTMNADGAQGTWRSATRKLDYLAMLGVNMLEIMTPAEFPGAVSWGYNPVYPFALERTYGSPDDAKTFVDGAHARGMGVIIDVVHNHYGNADSNVELDMFCFDGDCLGAAGSYFYTGARSRSPWGFCPNFARPQIQDYIVDNTLMWLRNYRADGLRWDAAFAVRSIDGADIKEGWDVLRRANDAAAKEPTPKLLMAEDLKLGV